MIIGIAGTIGSGKDTIAEYLVKKGFYYFSLSDEIREILKEKNIPETIENLVKMGNKLRKKFGPSYLAKVVKKKLKRPAVITSIRNVNEIKSFKKLNDFFLIGITANRKIRFKRIKKRNSKRDKLTYQNFVKQEEAQEQAGENEIHLSLCLKNADYLIENNGTFDELYKKVEEIIYSIKTLDKV